MRRSFFLSLAVLFGLGPPTAIRAQALGDSNVAAPLPSPRYPEGIAIRGHRFYVPGAAFRQPLGSAYLCASDIKTGAREATYPITITNPLAGMSTASCALRP